MAIRHKDNVLENMATRYVINKLKNTVDMLDVFSYDKQITDCLNCLDMINRCTKILNKRNKQNEFFE